MEIAEFRFTLERLGQLQTESLQDRFVDLHLEFLLVLNGHVGRLGLAFENVCAHVAGDLAEFIVVNADGGQTAAAQRESTLACIPAASTTLPAGMVCMAPVLSS